MNFYYLGNVRILGDLLSRIDVDDVGRKRRNEKSNWNRCSQHLDDSFPRTHVTGSTEKKNINSQKSREIKHKKGFKVTIDNNIQ